jgi:multiple sugar transport system substrate-binding protein
MNITNTNRAVLFSIIGLFVISFLYRYFPSEKFSPKTTIHLDLFQDEKPELQNLIAKFEEINPEIDVVPVYHSYQDLAKKMINPDAKAASENPETNKKKIQSDLVMFDMDWLPNLLENGLLESLADFPKDDSDVNMLYETSKIDGKSYAIPLFSHPSVFFYNIDMLQSAGFDRPPKTREDFLRYCRVLQEKQIAGIAFALSEENRAGMRHSGMLDDIYSWVWNSDIHFIEDDEAQFSSKPILETLQFFDILNKEHILSPNSFSKTESAKIDEFCSGKTAMMIASFSSLSEIDERAHFEWGISSVPTAISYIGNPLFVTETSGMGMYAESEHKADAWKFLAFLAGAEENTELASMYQSLPKNQNAEILFAENIPQREKALELFNAGREINEFDIQPGSFSAENIIRDELQKMISGSQSPESAAEAIQAQWSKSFTL